MQSYDSSDDEHIGDVVKHKKSNARRSLESQFSAASDQQRSLERQDYEVDQEENVPLQAGIESLPSTYEKLPVRTPSFCAAVSESLNSLDLELSNQGSECKILEESPRKKSKTPTRSVATLPSTPKTPVPKQTSTPGPSHSDVQVSLSSESVAICRICHEGDAAESLLSPCYCTGSVGMLHLSCLELWLGTSNTTRCEICKYEFKVQRKPKSFWDFVRHSRTGSERKNLICDIICFFVLTPLTMLSAYLCLNGVSYYSRWSDRWEVPGLICLTICLLIIFLVWCIIATRHHMLVLIQWRKHNQVIKIVYLSPVKGKAVLKASPKLDKNENNIHPPSTWQNINNSRPTAWQNITNSRQGTPSRTSRSYSVTMSIVSSHTDASTSYHAAMLRPILRYSANAEGYSYRSDLESTVCTSHTVKWAPSEKTISLTSPLVRTESDVSNGSWVGKETYI